MLQIDALLLAQICSRLMVPTSKAAYQVPTSVGCVASCNAHSGLRLPKWVT
jgi:hypothetical protein